MRSTRALIILTLALCGISARAQYAANAYTNAYAAGAGSPAPMPYMQGPGPVAQPQAGLPYGECRAQTRRSINTERFIVLLFFCKQLIITMSGIPLPLQVPVFMQDSQLRARDWPRQVTLTSMQLALA
jgi:hypothetical protein